MAGVFDLDAIEDGAVPVAPATAETKAGEPAAYEDDDIDDTDYVPAPRRELAGLKVRVRGAAASRAPARRDGGARTQAT